MMSTLRFALIRVWLWLLRVMSTDEADPADVYFGYRLLLGRPPEPSGWRNQLHFIRPGRRRRLVAELFLNSPEFQAGYQCADSTSAQTARFIMWLDPEDPHIAPSILAGQAYEPHVTAALERELTPDSVFVDIGANMGWFALTAAGIARQVIAIEPNHHNVQLLYRSLLANGYTNVQVVPQAVTDQPRLLQLHSVHSNGHVSAADGAAGASVLVEGQPLDALLRCAERVDVIKMDIEGHEPVALRGMTGVLARFRPVLLLEFHPAAIRANAGEDPAAFLESLTGLGYNLLVIGPDGAEVGPLDTAGIFEEWKAINRRLRMEGAMHLDLIGRPR